MVYPIALDEQTPNCTFFQICHSAVAPPSVVETKLNAGAKLQTFFFPIMPRSFHIPTRW